MSAINESVGSGFRIGNVLNQTFGLFFGKFFPLNLLVFVFHLPVYALSVYQIMNMGELGAISTDNTVTEILSTVLSLVVSSAAAAAITFAVFETLNGRTINVGNCISKSFSVLVPVILAGILVGLIATVGTILLIIPGVFAVIVLVVTIPSIVLENKGVIDGLKRSAELTKGNRWEILGLLLVFLVLVVIAYLVFIFLFGLMGGMGMGLVTIGIIFLTLTVFSTTLGLIFSTVIYSELRQAKDGISVDQIASVFE